MRTRLAICGVLCWTGLSSVVTSCGRDSTGGVSPASPGAMGIAAQALVRRCADNPIGPNGYHPDKQVFWGELHLHTGYSLDAYSFGTRTTPAQAYLWAKGDGYEITVGSGTLAPHGPNITQPRKLDFVAVTDHAEFLSVVSGCVLREQSGFYDDPGGLCARVRSEVPDTQDGVFPAMGDIVLGLCANAANVELCIAQQRSAWQDIQRAARDANDPCYFTAFVGYEWSDQDPVQVEDGGLVVDGGVTVSATNHRNVIFASANVPDLPFSSILHRDPPALWHALEAQCTGTCEAVTIPHNTNLSAGISLQVWDPSPNGRRLQSKYQVAAEIYQHKGASECHYDPAAGYNDPDCAFEQLDSRLEDVPKVPGSFLRNGLARGLAAALLRGDGENPFKLGFVAGTDGHNGAPGNVDEATWVGHDGRKDDDPRFRLTDRPDWGPGGITGVWAHENTRRDIFKAIQRRETFATSGPRIRARVFQTAETGACSDPNYPGSILPRANPMGSTFHRRNLRGAASPTFIIDAWPDSEAQQLATRDPAMALLERVQVIKIAVGPAVAAGQPVTRTYDVTVAQGFNPSGACMTWEDPDFDPTAAALYYVRVLQEPTWRWTHHDCLALEGTGWAPWDALCGPGGVIPQDAVRERAWTSPIWYEPSPRQ